MITLHHFITYTTIVLDHETECLVTHTEQHNIGVYDFKW